MSGFLEAAQLQNFTLKHTTTINDTYLHTYGTPAARMANCADSLDHQVLANLALLPFVEAHLLGQRTPLMTGPFLCRLKLHSMFDQRLHSVHPMALAFQFRKLRLKTRKPNSKD